MANVKSSNSTNKMTVKPTGNPVTYSVRTDVNNNKIVTNASKETNTFAIKDNMSEYYARLSESFACGNGIINGVDYSSKHYAEESKAYSISVEALKDEILEETASFDEEVQFAKDNIEENRVNSISTINNACDSAVNDILAIQNNAERNITNVVNGYLEELDASVKALPMFTPIWSDHILNDASYLRADTFSWHSGNIYTAGYNILLNEYNSDKCIEELEGNVTYKRTPSGFKIADIEQHENILTTFTMTGKSWFYVIDIETKRFKLPRTQYSFTGIRDTVGGDVEAGLPSLSSNSTGAHTHSRGTMNITGTWRQGGDGYGTIQAGGVATGAFYKSGSELANTPSFGSTNGYVLGFDASKSWTGATSSNGGHSHTITDSAGVLGRSNTVQPPATQMYLYFFIGNYSRPTTDVNIGELCEIVNNIDLETLVESVTNEINTLKDNSMNEFNVAKDNVLNSFETQVNSSLTELNTTKNNCITQINNTGINNRVLKTGDTMTGDLTVTRAGTPCIFIKSEQDRAIAPSANAGTQYMHFTDKNDSALGNVAIERYTNGRNTIKLQAFSTDGSTAPAVRVNAYADNTIGCDFPKCTTKATTTSSARSDLVAVITQNYVNGTSWYRVWSDGWIEQGGYNQMTSTTITVTMLKSFSNQSFNLQATRAGSSGQNPIIITPTAVNQFKINIASASTSVYAYWYACGY